MRPLPRSPAASSMSTDTAPARPPQFIWAPVPGAKSYRISFFRGRALVYSAVTTVPRHTLPLRWKFAGKGYRLTKGTYRWVVVPRRAAPGGARDRTPVVDATYTV